MAVSAPDVLVLRALGLGDLLTAVPALRALRRAYPGARLTLACPAPLHELVDHWKLADDALDVPPLGRLPRSAHRAEIAVNLHGRGPQSTARLAETRPARLLAFAHPAVPETAGMPAWRPGENEVGRWCRLLEGCGIATDPTELDLVPPEDCRDPGEARVVLHPGASAPARRWPVRRWIDIARRLRGRGARVVLTGNLAEQEACALIGRGARLALGDVVAGQTSLVGLARIVARARLVVCGDTGVAHLATALGTPSVVLFGPVSPQEWGPPPERPIHRALWSGASGDPHARTTDAGLLALTTADVWRAIEEVGGPDAAAVLREGGLPAG